MCHDNRELECAMTIGSRMCHVNRELECVMAIGIKNVSWQ